MQLFDSSASLADAGRACAPLRKAPQVPRSSRRTVNSCGRPCRQNCTRSSGATVNSRGRPCRRKHAVLGGTVNTSNLALHRLREGRRAISCSGAGMDGPRSLRFFWMSVGCEGHALRQRKLGLQKHMRRRCRVHLSVRDTCPIRRSDKETWGESGGRNVSGSPLFWKASNPRGWRAGAQNAAGAQRAFEARVVAREAVGKGCPALGQQTRPCAREESLVSRPGFCAAARLRCRGGGAIVRPLSWGELPESLQGCLVSVGLDETTFQAVAGTDWSREWRGWCDVRDSMNDSSIMEWTQRFLRVTSQNTNVWMSRQPHASAGIGEGGASLGAGRRRR